MSERLNICITFPIDKPEGFKIETDIKDEFVAELIGEFLREQIGAGRDSSSPDRREIYTIHLQLDLSEDVWYCKHDCGNLGFRDGILMDVMGRLR